MWLHGLVLGVGALILAALAWDCLRWGIVPAPTFGEAQRRCLELMAQQHVRGQVIDAGSGWGSMACAMAARLPEADVVGVEGSRFAHSLARLLGMALGARVRWVCADFYGYDTRHCVGIFCYLYPAAMARLASQLRAGLSPQAWVVSYAFALPGWRPDQVVHLGGRFASPIYLYLRSSQLPPATT